MGGMTCENNQNKSLADRLAAISPKRVESDNLVVEERSAADIRSLLSLEVSLGKRRGFRAVARTQFRKPAAVSREDGQAN